jgi:hypothetical protein
MIVYKQRKVKILPIANLIPMEAISAQLADQTELKEKPKGVRLISDVALFGLTSERVRASEHMKRND